jgi:tetratricopeptide (TPR) repeat protein
MGRQRVEGSRNVLIQGTDRSLIQVTYNESSYTVPLEPARIPVSPTTPSPARLVRAHSGVVPYVDHDELLAGLERWVDSTSPFASHVIEGRGGAGKTRLAVKLCEVLEESNWLCGFLFRRAGEGRLDALVNTPTPRLVVIDYAEHRAEQVEQLVPFLRANATDAAPVRLLLLVRTGPAQARNWPQRLGDLVDSLDETLEQSPVQTLDDTPLTREDRQRLFEVARAAFADRLRPERTDAAAPDFDAAVFENPLIVVSAAYLAAHGEEVPSDRIELFDELLAHERRYWRLSSSGLGIDDTLLERIVALATLTDADDEVEAAGLLRLIPDLKDAPQERRNRLARWTADQYPGPRWWNPVEPDLVGEHLVSRCFADLPEVLQGVLVAEPEKVARPLGVLTRASADHVALAESFARVLNRELPPLCRLAIAEAESIRDLDLLYSGATTAATAVADAISIVDIEQEAAAGAAAAMRMMPQLLLSDLAASVIALDIEQRLRPAADDESSASAAALADALSKLSSHLAEVGRYDEAMVAGEEAVRLHRALNDTDPTRHGEALATALNNFSGHLMRDGDHDAALAVTEEAVDVYRKADDGSDGDRERLAIALGNLSVHLAAVGRNEDGLDAAEEAVRILRPLAKEDPAALGASLAAGLRNLALRLGAVGRRSEAVTAIKEAVAIRRPLAAEHPAAYGAELANVLTISAGLSMEAGETDAALETIDEAIALYRSLVAVNEVAYEENLAMALHNFSAMLTGGVGPTVRSRRQTDPQDHEQALAASNEAVEIWRQLAAARPAAHSPVLATGLNSLAIHLAELGRQEKALKVIAEAIEIIRPFTAERPAVHGATLAMALNSRSNILATLDRPDEALDAAVEAVEAFRPAVEHNPAGSAVDFAVVLNNLARRLAATGRDEQAARVKEELASLLDEL